MIIGVPKEIKAGEKRVGIVPEAAKKIVEIGHRLLIEKSAGETSGYGDKDYKDVGAIIVDDTKKIWEEADMIVKIKEPQEKEIAYFREEMIIFSYLHLETKEDLVEAFQKNKVIGIAMEKVQTEDGAHVLYPPMSEITGRIAVLKGANLLFNSNGGSGVLLGKVPDTNPAKVLIIGGGSVGSSAAVTAAGLGTQVVIFDINPNRVRFLNNILPNNVIAYVSDENLIRKEIIDADLVIGAVLISRPGDSHIITEEMVKTMKAGSVIIDATVGYGGYIETAKKGTTHDNPIYIVHDVIHYCVPNIPAEVPNTSSIAFSKATLPYILELAEKGYRKALLENKAMLKGVNVIDGKVTYELVAETFNKKLYSAEDILQTS